MACSRRRYLHTPALDTSRAVVVLPPGSITRIWKTLRPRHMIGLTSTRRPGRPPSSCASTPLLLMASLAVQVLLLKWVPWYTGPVASTLHDIQWWPRKPANRRSVGDRPGCQRIKLGPVMATPRVLRARLTSSEADH